MQSGNLKFLEPSRPLQACNGTSLPLPPCLCGTEEIEPGKIRKERRKMMEEALVEYGNGNEDNTNNLGTVNYCLILWSNL